TLDGESSAIFALEDSISSRVAQAMTRNLTGQEQALLTKRDTNNPDAYVACLKGRYFWNKRTFDGFKKGIEFFEEARRIDPDCALAYAGVADCSMLGGSLPDGRSRDPKALALRALELDDSLAEAHTTLAYYEGAIEWNWDGAEREFGRALDINPSYV